MDANGAGFDESQQTKAESEQQCLNGNIQKELSSNAKGNSRPSTHRKHKRYSRRRDRHRVPSLELTGTDA